jgi:hypothetical protein
LSGAPRRRQWSAGETAAIVARGQIGMMVVPAGARVLVAIRRWSNSDPLTQKIHQPATAKARSAAIG